MAAHTASPDGSGSALSFRDCGSCGFVNKLQDPKFCCQCGAMLEMVEVTMTWHERERSRTPSPSASRCIHSRCHDSLDNASVTTRRDEGVGMTRNSSSFALLMRLQAAGPDWREVEGLPRSPDASPKFASPRGGFGGLLSPPPRKTKASWDDKELPEASFTRQITPEEYQRAKSGGLELSPSENDLEAALAGQPAKGRRGTEIRRFVRITELRYTPSFPRILCVTRRHLRKNKYVDITGEYHLDLVQKFGGAPIIIPRTVRTIEQVAEYLPMDGLLIAEGNDLSDDILLKYGCSLPERLNEEAAKKYAGDTELDISKDELEFALMRFALAAGVPILTFCRGSQMLNCLRGGGLIGDIETQTESKIQHLRECGAPDYDSFRHPIEVKPNTPIAEWFADSLPHGATELSVNSYHHQACYPLGSNLVPMAHAPDGIIEAFYDPSYSPVEGQFVVGLQFHPERMLEDYPGCERCYESFLQASTAYKNVQECESA